MSMRYLIKRKNPENIQELTKEIPNLMEQLGDPSVLSGPQEGLRRTIDVTLSPRRAIQYSFVSRKSGEAYSWICASKELVAETEEDLREMCRLAEVTQLSHLRR